MIEQVETFALTALAVACVFFITAWVKADRAARFHQGRAEVMRERWLEAEGKLNAIPGGVSKHTPDLYYPGVHRLRTKKHGYDIACLECGAWNDSKRKDCIECAHELPNIAPFMGGRPQ